MVKASREDIIFGFMCYKRLNPHFPLNPNAPPPVCINSNPFVDGHAQNLIYSDSLLSSCVCDVTFDSNGQPHLSDDVRYGGVDPFESAWAEICNNWVHFDTTFLNEFIRRYDSITDLQILGYLQPVAVVLGLA